MSTLILFHEKKRLFTQDQRIFIKKENAFFYANVLRNIYTLLDSLKNRHIHDRNEEFTIDGEILCIRYNSHVYSMVEGELLFQYPLIK